MIATLWRLSAPATGTDRTRFRLVAAATAGVGVFALAAVAIATGRERGTAERFDDGSVYSYSADNAQGLAPYLVEPGLRGGTTFGAALLMLPFALFGLQALRTGTAARERRLAALSLAGATRGQLRRLAVLEGTRAAVLGGVLAGPAYLGLWLLAGRAMPAGWRLLPEPQGQLAVAWPLLVVVLAGLASAAAAATARVATVTPLGISRRRPRPLGPVRLGVTLLALLVAVPVVPWAFWAERGTDVGIPILFAGVIVLAVAGGPLLTLLVGRLAAGRADLTTSLAGRRLVDDPRTPGRVATVLFTVGVTLGVSTSQVGELLQEPNREWSDLTFYLGGFGAAVAGAALAAVVACLSLVVGATEQVLDGRRSVAVLVALAASPRFVHGVVRRQLVLAAVPPAVLGALLASLLWLPVSGGDDGVPVRMPWLDAASPPVALLVAAVAAVAGGLVAARAVGPAVDEAARPQTLRAA